MSNAAGVPAEAMKTLQVFLEAGLRQDEKAMRACLSRKSLESGQLDPSSSPKGAKFLFKESHMEGEQAIIQVRAVPQEGPDDAPPLLEMPCIMVKEDGVWKFDLGTTVDRMMGGLEAAMGEMTKVMGDAMKGIGEAMGEAMTEAFGPSTGGEAKPQGEPPQNEPKPKSRKKKSGR